jgi:hypothetical protein
VATHVLTWSGPEGGQIGVGFDDEHFSLEEMFAEIALVGETYPNLPDEVPLGTRFVLAKESTGHLMARFRVAHTVYRSGGQPDLHRLWDSVALIDQLSHPERYKIAS